MPAVPVAYIRVSTEEQATAGVSLAAQEERIRAYCLAHGLTLGGIYTDAGASGKSLERPALASLLADIRAGKIGTLVVVKLDRLTRRTRDLLHLVEDVFTRRGVELVSLSEQLDTRTPAGRLMLTLLGALAQMEREQIAERTRVAMRYKRSRRERVGKVPLGFRVRGPGEPMEPVAREMATVRRILHLREAGESFPKIAATLTAEGHPTKEGGSWAPSTVWKVWRGRDRYAGLVA